MKAINRWRNARLFQVHCPSRAHATLCNNCVNNSHQRKNGIWIWRKKPNELKKGLKKNFHASMSIRSCGHIESPPSCQNRPISKHWCICISKHELLVLVKLSIGYFHWNWEKKKKKKKTESSCCCTQLTLIMSWLENRFLSSTHKFYSP